MSLAEGTYLIHFSAEETVNYYAYGRDVGKAIATVSTSSRNNPTLVRGNEYLIPVNFADRVQWRVQKHPSSNTYTISAAEGTNGHWARSDHLDKVMFSSQSRGWTSHWRIVDIDSRGGLYGSDSVLLPTLHHVNWFVAGLLAQSMKGYSLTSTNETTRIQ